ncbi:MAG TPA: amino acid adenylation domain-containing protein [Longimicrobium sp.]
MTAPNPSAAPLSRDQKQELLRRILAEKMSRARTAPASFAQERLWFLDRMEAGSALYNIPAALRLTGALNAAALERALGEIVRRHESLRTTFREVDGAPLQVIAPFAGFALAVDDLSAADAASREAQVRRRARDNREQAFDLAAGPLFRASLLRLAADEHVLLVCIHHVVSDGWSMGVFFRELSALYEAYGSGAASPLAEPAAQYGDYAARQREQLNGQALDRQIAYWKGQLAGAPALLELPTDHARPAVQSSRGAFERVELSAGVLERLQTVARGEGATLYMLLLGAWQVLLGKYAGTADVVVGSPIAGRTRSELEGLIGFFVNTLVLRTDLSGDPTFREVVRRVRAVTLGAYEHQDVPFERLVAELQPERSLSHSPLFQVMFALQEGGGAGPALAGLQVRGVEAEVATTKFDLALSLAADARGMRGEISYCTDLFDAATIRRMLGHLERVLEQVAADPDVRLSGLELLTAPERAVVVDEWNRNAQPYPADACIHTLFEAQAARTPDAVAIVHEHDSLTYAELNARANRLAHHLAGLGVGPEVRVGIGLERGVPMVTAILAVLKAGGAYVPLDTAYPAERLAFTLADSDVAVLLTQETLRGMLPVRDGVRVVSLDESAAAIAAERGDDPRVAVTPRNLGYLIYTSGSTGVPKGVAIEHQSAVALLSWAAGIHTAEELSGMLAATSICFDLSVYELFLPLSLGGTVIVVDNALAVTESAAADRVRLINTVPSAIAALLRAGGIPAGVTTVNLAGEPLKQALVDALYAHGISRVYDLYGPSEDTTYSTYTLRAAGGEASIGRAIANSQAYVLDGGMKPVPVGVAGELFLGGCGLARGYLGRPSLSAEKFVADPFAARPGARMYRTGDKVRWRADGTLEYLGRLDEQVKVRGFRIELGEIEATLRRAGAADCVVVARADDAGEKRLVAYVVGGVAEDDLRAALRRSVPEYMVPSAFVMLDALPLTPNGKIDKKALPAPEFAGAAEAYVSPRTPTEEVVAGIWAEVLRVERVGSRDSFFALGGHSLMATRVVSRVRQLFGVELPLRALFEGPTVAELAERIETLRRAGAPVLPPVVAVARTGGIPLSFAQERLWFLDRLEGGSPLYNVPAALRLTGALDFAAMERALGEIVRRHEALRTTFAEVDGAGVQVIAPFAGFALPVEALEGVDDDAREAEVRRRATADAARPFDLAAGPLFRATLLRLADEEHVLLVCMHHVVSDGWSMGIFFRELSALYEAYRNGAESPLAPLAVQYADHAAWQRRELEGEALDRQVGYWKDRLAGAPALLELPTDFARPAVQSYRGARETFALPPELLARLEALARGEGATLYMVLLGAFQLLLAKYSGADDVVVGTPIAGRTRRQTEELIGFFINTLVLRTQLDGDPAFREVLRRVRDVTLGAYEHQDVPFERLVAELQPERTLSHAPLFQVMFTLQNTDRSIGTLPGLAVQGVGAELETAKFDLSLTVSADAHGLRGVMAYSTDLFRRGTIERMLRHLARVLEQVAAAPEARLSEIGLLDDVERAQVLEEWNRTEAGYFSNLCIHHLFQARAERTPDAVALVCEDDSLTCGALNARANQLAHHLRGLGVGPDAVVAMHLGRGVEAVVALLGILKAGGAYLALDPALPGERLAYMLEDSGAVALVTRGESAYALPAGRIPVVHIDGEAVREESDTDPQGGAGPDDLVYVIYTSGSTGRPKGVGVEHRQIASYLFGLRDRLELPEGASYATVSTLSADLGNTVVFSALAWGGTLHVIGEDRLFSGDALGEYFARHDIDCLKITPSHLAALQTGGDPRRVMPRRWLVLGGESSPVRWVDELVAMAPECAVFNHYGPTETTVGALTHRVGAERTETASGTLVLGRPLPNYQVFVVDAHLRPVPVGVPGELLIGGAGVARGYLGRPELTAEKFIRNPFGEGRLYRTGDRCRWLADGTVEFLGRMDQQVKIRGFRVEPGEVEAALRQHAGVTECVVIAREDVPGDRRLVAYVVGDADADGLRGELRRTLPDYMVPGAFVALEQIPLTPNGKVDRRALPAPDTAADASRYVAPRTPTEEVLAGVWAELLRRERVGVEESFFELGGHSLLATRVVSRVREVFGVELPLRALFEEPTVAGMAERVERLRRDGAPGLPPVVAVDRARPLPLSFAQERLWFLDRLEGASAVYNVPAALRLSGALDVPALERAFGEVVRRHESLRTTFRQAGETAVQVVAPFAGFHLPVEDLSGMDEDAREARMRARAAEEASRPFDLSAGPLLRVALLRTADDEHVLLVCIHHIVSDAWSRGVLFRELTALYKTYRRGEPSLLPALPVQYADFAVWQREQLDGPALDRQLAWWKDRLADAPALLELPTDRPRPAVQTYRGAAEPVVLSAALARRLEALARGEGATLYMVLLAAFQVLLGKYAGSEDVVVGSPIAGRTRRETEELIGFFVNTLVLRTDLSGAPSFRTVLRRVRDVTLGAYENQEVPFEKLVAELQPERSRSHAPLFQVMFTLQNTDRAVGTLDGVPMRSVGAASETTKFDLTLALGADGDGLRGVLEYATDLFDAATVARMAGHLGRVLEQVADAADRPVGALSLPDAAERARVVGEWNRTETAYAADRTLHGLFEAQAARTPDACAVSYENDSLSYAELNAAANRLAHHLRRHGVGPEVRVGLALERGVEMVVSILATLKAGGAYVPMDPGYPIDRLAHIVADSGVPVLVTQESVRGTLPVQAGVTLVSVDADAALIAVERQENPESGATPESLAYVIYTSGSTGKPKGALIEHRNVARLFSATEAWFGFGPDDVWTLFHSCAFDFSVWELWGALLYGGRVVVVPFAVSRDPEAFHALVQAEGVTILNQTPSAFRQFIRVDEVRGGPLALREVVFGGEALEPATLREWVARRGIDAPRLVNMYGITETTVHVTYRPLTAADVFGGGGSPIGVRIPDLQLYVLDAGMQPLPVGVPGELYVGGGGVARGYLNRPELTEQRFIPNPFGAGRLYRTGDRVRWLADGTLDYMGRLDEQVKIRGFRIELGEIEASLLSYPAVRECAVVVREDAPGDRRIVAYVVGWAPPEELRGHLRHGLPEYMVPSAFVTMDSLPMTANGKLDRRALPAPEYGAAEDRYVAPRTPLEEVLAEVWAEVLNLEAVGVEDDFFELGGHSLLAVRMVWRIREVFGVELPLRTFFDVGTIAELGVLMGTDPAYAESTARVLRLLLQLEDAPEEEVLEGLR